MEVKVYNQEGKEVETATLPEVFNVPVNHDLLVQVVNSQSANARKIVANAKNRAEVRGGGKKPWQQKGTGRARHGSIRSPIWKGGGVTHGPTSERNFTKKINKKMAAKALAMTIGGKAKDGELVLLEGLSLASAKTKEAAGVISKVFQAKPLSAFASKSKVLMLTGDASNETRAFRNIERLTVVRADAVTVKELLSKTALIASKTALAALEKRILHQLKPRIYTKRIHEHTRT